MRVLVTGSSNGIGKAISLEFLNNGHEVVGFDVKEATISNPNYHHEMIDVYKSELPNMDAFDIIINNAGVQESGMDIEINLKGSMRITEFYAFQDKIKSVLFIASASALTGAEFPEYVASKGGMVSYMKNVALRLAKFNATSNSLSPGGVITDLNSHILENKDLWDAVMAETLLPKWASVEEIAKWAYFVTVVNKSMTAQDILIDNGEAAKANFIW